MIQYNTLNLKLSNSQRSKLKSGIKDGIGGSTDQNNFPHKLFLSNTQVWWLRKTFENGSSASVKLSITQLSKIRQSGGFLGRLLQLLRKTSLPLMKT